MKSLSKETLIPSSFNLQVTLCSIELFKFPVSTSDNLQLSMHDLLKTVHQIVSDTT